MYRSRKIWCRPAFAASVPSIFDVVGLSGWLGIVRIKIDGFSFVSILISDEEMFCGLGGISIVRSLEQLQDVRLGGLDLRDAVQDGGYL